MCIGLIAEVLGSRGPKFEWYFTNPNSVTSPSWLFKRLVYLLIPCLSQNMRISHYMCRTLLHSHQKTEPEKCESRNWHFGKFQVVTYFYYHCGLSFRHYEDYSYLPDSFITWLTQQSKDHAGPSLSSGMVKVDEVTLLCIDCAGLDLFRISIIFYQETCDQNSNDNCL